MPPFHLPKPVASAAAARRLWQNPPAAFRGKPFWSWNSQLDVGELKRQASIFKTMGMGGYFMHSRTGLATEYLGPEWFGAINAMADEAERLGVEAWIYDEDRWPSGSAGGRATQDEAFQMKRLRCRIYAPGGTAANTALPCVTGPIAWPDEDHFIRAFTVELDGLNLGDYAPLDYRALSEPEGATVLIFSWEPMARNSFYNGNTYLDTMDRDAVENFLRITHDKYAEECGDRLGQSIPGIFTDEPHRGMVMLGDPASGDSAQEFLTAPWTPKLPEAFRESFGYDLRDVLPEIYFRQSGERLSPHKWRYMELLQQLFIECWAKPCLDRAHQLGMVLTGHVFHEDALIAQALPQGSMARYYEFTDIPGIDVLGNDNEKFWIAKQLQSVARQQGKPWLLSELYGCSGWHMSLSDHKRMGDWQALFGINVRCHHLSWYTMAGEAKRDYPASIFYQSPWWREYNSVETYFSRLHAILQAGEPVCDVLVVNPVESFWAQIHPGWARWVAAGCEHLQAIQTKSEQLFLWLQGNRIDFDYGDEEHIKRLATITTNEDEPVIRLGEMSYRTVVVAGCETLRASTVERLESFAARGGRVIFAGDPPNYVDAERSDRARALAATATVVAWGEANLLAVVQERTASALLKVQGASRSVLAQMRKLEDGWLVVLLNTSETEDQGALTVSLAVSIQGGVAVEQWDALSGGITAVASQSESTGTTWQTALPPLQERVFHIRSAAVESGSSQDAPQTLAPGSDVAFGDEIEVAGPFAYELGEPNILVLDYARFGVDGADMSEPQEILKIEEALCSQTGISVRDGYMVQPWARKKAEQSPASPVHGNGRRVELRFDFAISAMPTEPVFLLMEPIDGQTISLNGNASAVRAIEGEWLVDPCFQKFAIDTTALREGTNTISLQFEFREGVDLEAIYLGGEFGVRLAPSGNHHCIEQLPEHLATGEVGAQGLPFYGDRICYRLPVSHPGRLVVEHVGASCVAFEGAGKRVVIPWGEFVYEVTKADVQKGAVTCELILTRRNTFGPLHFADPKLNWVAPGCFRSQGDDWTDDYVLFPCGLTSVRFAPLV